MMKTAVKTGTSYLLLVLALTAGLLSGLALPAGATASQFEEEIYDVPVWVIHTDNFLFVLGQDRVLWAYDANDGWAAREMMRDVVKISMCNEGGVVQSVFALKPDGSLWQMQDGSWIFDGEPHDELTEPIRIMTGVKDIEYSDVLTAEGTVMELERTASGWEALPTGDCGVESFRQKTLQVLRESNERYWDGGLPEEENIEKFVDSFLLTKSGDLWSWGYSNYGDLGRGADYSWDESRYFQEDQWVVSTLVYNTPEIILTDVKTFWQDDNTHRSYALKRDGSVWLWGDGEPAMTHGVDFYAVEVVLPEDLTGWTPRKIADSLAYRDLFMEYETICLRFYADGALVLNPDGEGIRLKDWASVPEDALPFADVEPGSYCYDAVKWALEAGVTTGLTFDTFGPEETVTRGQCVTFLWRAMGRPEPDSEACPFADVKASDYCFKAVLWAAENGITNGVDETHFAPGGTLSTAHILTFLYRTVNPGKDGWYAEAWSWAREEGLLASLEIVISPDESCSRAEAVTFLFRELK